MVDSLEAALWAFYRSRDFREGALLAVNLGDNSVWITLHVRTEDDELTKHLFDELKFDQEQIERGVDAGPHPEWQWLRHDRYAFSTINIRIDGSIDDPPEKLEKTKAWMLDLLPKFKEAFDPRLAQALGSK